MNILLIRGDELVRFFANHQHATIDRQHSTSCACLYSLIFVRLAVFVCAILLFIPIAAAGTKTEITKYILHNQSPAGGNSIPISFAQVFARGDVSMQDNLFLQDESGKRIRLQVDRKARHHDGSLRHAVLSAIFPADLTKRSQLTLYKENQYKEDKRPTGEGDYSNTLSTEQLLERAVETQVRMMIGNHLYSASLRDAMKSKPFAQWLRGPIVNEWLFAADLSDETGRTHPHLAVYFYLRVYQDQPHVSVDVVVENNWSLQRDVRDVNYDVEIRAANRVVYSYIGLTHYRNARWHKKIWWGNEPKFYLERDTQYIQASGAVPNYEKLYVSKILLDSFIHYVEPMDNGMHKDYMGTTGFQPAIGPLPQWEAAYLISSHQKAYLAVMANADGAAAYSMHYRDKKTGRPLSILNYPQLSLHDEKAFPSIKSANPHFHDQAHQPSMAYLAYLLSGEYYYLEEMQFWTVWNFLDTHPELYRQNEKGIFGVQVRGQAWALRNLAQAAYITPDSDSLKNLFVKSLHNNLQHNNQRYAQNPQANKLGMIKSYDGLTEARPWMDDFYTYVMGYIVELGFDAAIPMRDWKVANIINRIGKNEAYCWQFATGYHATQGPDNKNWYASFDEYWLANWGNKSVNGVKLKDVPCGSPQMTQWMDDSDNSNWQMPYKDFQIYGSARPYEDSSYYANMQPAVAITVDSKLPGSQLAGYRFFIKTPVRPDYSDNPQWAVVPRVAITYKE